ncbi:MAG: NUDIX hydrolase YfcD [Bryobacteraceae bacterium]|nr:NUDIX hydrolase YfcD [Bryobacteraceae bacterium]MDW8379947.1 NUDIX hydrolase YfcD [Bryobacterales bacterium]
MARDELIVVVDEQNREVGVAPRWRMRAERLGHRSTYIFVFDSQGRLYVQHRTETKDVFPGYWDLAAGGVVLAGETYEESAERELAEELGIRGVTLEPWFDFYFAAHRVWGRAYGCRYEGPLALQPEEVQGVERMSVSEVYANPNGRLFTPDSLYALRRKFGLNPNPDLSILIK